MKRTLILMLMVLLSGCGSSNVPEVKANAPAVWRQAGFEVVGYEGYQNGRCLFVYGCGRVWHTMRRIPDNGIVYHGFIEKWGGEYHIYNLAAIDAIKPGN